jgi:hypothetical protein
MSRGKNEYVTPVLVIILQAFMTIETMAFYHNYDKSNTTGGTNGAGNV